MTTPTDTENTTTKQPPLNLGPDDPTAIGCIGLGTPNRPLPHCGKLVMPGTEFCLSCEAIRNYLKDEPKRRAAKARQTIEARYAKERFLAVSPLRSFNPEFDIENQHGMRRGYRRRRKAWTPARLSPETVVVEE
jgi:hypothetical protein